MSDGLWFRLNGDFVEHPQVIDLSDRAFRLYVAGLCYTTRNLTDGFLSERAVKVLCALTSAQRRHVVELREAGRWVAHDDGWDIHDYLIYNPTAAEIKALREARSSAGRIGGLNSGITRRAKSEASASSKAEASALASAQATRQAKTKHRTEPEQNQEDQLPEQDVPIAALVDISDKQRQRIQPLIDVLPSNEVKPNTRTVLASKFAVLPAHFVELAREELLAAQDVRSPVRYLNGIADRMLTEQGRRPAA